MSELSDVERRFDAALSAVEAKLGDDPELLPARLARAARDCLPVAGAGLSLRDGLDQIPVGASDAMAARAERLQFTAGSGPALDARQSGHAIAADEDAIPLRWSPFAAELFRQTPFRAIVSMPLSSETDWHMVLDLYLTDGQLPQLRFLDVATVTEQIANRLFSGATPGVPERWLDAPAVRGRQQVWIALGRLIEHGVPPETGLALLRARALTLDTDLDDVAARITSGELDLEQLLPDTAQ